MHTPPHADLHTGTAASQLRWHVEPTQPDTPDGSSNFACGEDTSIYASYEFDPQVIFELAEGASGEVEYTLTVAVHSYTEFDSSPNLSSAKRIYLIDASTPSFEKVSE